MPANNIVTLSRGSWEAPGIDCRVFTPLPLPATAYTILRRLAEAVEEAVAQLDADGVFIEEDE